MVNHTNKIPKNFVATIDVRDDDSAKIIITDIIEWAECMRGDVWWTKIQFRDPRFSGGTMVLNNRKRNFKDGYFLYKFWFARKSDAALFVIFWGHK